MTHVRMLGLCLVAVLALSALAAESASAFAPEPEYKSCVKKTGGHYTSKECAAASKVETGGKYELEAVESGTTFTSKSKGATFTVKGKVVKCKKDTDTGEILSGNVDHEEITFTDCGVNGNKKEPCESTGASAGTIKTHPLLSFLYYINSAETEIGVLLYSAEGLAAFHCGAETIELHGSVLGAIKNSSKGETITFAVSGGKQEHRFAWIEGEEEGPVTLYTEPGKEEATLATVDEQGPKGVGAYS